MLRFLLPLLLLQDPVQAPSPEPPQTGGIDLKTLSEIVSRVTGKELIVPLSPIFAAQRVGIPPHEGKSPDALFAIFQSAVAGGGFGLVRDSRVANRYRIVMLEAPKSLAPPEYSDPAKLPEGEELCALTVRVGVIAPRVALEQVQRRLHPQLIRLAVTTADSITMVDFAPTLKQVARLIADADRAAAEGMASVEVQVWLLEVRPGMDVGEAEEVVQPELLAALNAKGLIGKFEKPLEVGRGIVRVSPSDQDKAVQASVALSNSGWPVARFHAKSDRTMVKLTSMSVMDIVPPNQNKVLCNADQVNLKPGEATVLSAWGNQVLVVRATVGK